MWSQIEAVNKKKRMLDIICGYCLLTQNCIASGLENITDRKSYILWEKGFYASDHVKYVYKKLHYWAVS